MLFSVRTGAVPLQATDKKLAPVSISMNGAACANSRRASWGGLFRPGGFLPLMFVVEIADLIVKAGSA